LVGLRVVKGLADNSFFADSRLGTTAGDPRLGT
jgi:hypothetical protein